MSDNFTPWKKGTRNTLQRNVDMTELEFRRQLPGKKSQNES